MLVVWAITVMFLFVEMLAGVLVMLALDKHQRLGNVATNTLVVRAKRSSR